MKPTRGRCLSLLPKKLGTKGSILIVTLWTLIILSILGAALGNFISAGMKFTNLFVRSIGSPFLARAAAYDAFYERKSDGTASYDTPEELLEKREQALKNDTGYSYYFEDEGSLININTVSAGTLKRLPGLDEDLAEAIAGSKRRPFRVKEEILLTEGIDRERFGRFKEIITVYGDGRININTAGKDTLSALGLEDELIELIMRFRREYIGEDGEFDTQDDGAFLSGANIVSELRKFAMLTLAQEQQILSLAHLWTAKSPYLRLKVSARINGRPGNEYSIVIDTANSRILSWEE